MNGKVQPSPDSVIVTFFPVLKQSSQKCAVCF